MERKPELFKNLLMLQLLILLSKLHSLMRSVWWWLTGRQADIDASMSLYETSAHKMGFHWKFIFDLFYPGDLVNFFLYHDKFIHPEYVLRDNVTLFQLTRSQAVFVEGDPNKDFAFKSSTYGFAAWGQLNTAHRVIVMPLSSFIRLSEEMNDDGAKKILIFNQGRVGSTLLTSIFEHTDRCVAISEPFALNKLSKQVVQDKIYSPERAKPLFRALIRMLCKPYRGLPEKTLAYVIKVTAMSMPAIEFMLDAVPECSPVFLYREPISLAQSARRIAEALPSIKFIYYLVEMGFPNGGHHGWSMLGVIGKPYDNYTSKARTGLEVGYVLAMETLHYREQARKNGYRVPAISFDDLRADPQDIVTQVFKYCGLPEDLVAPAVEAMKKDSQASTDINQENIRRLMTNPPEPTPLFMEEMRTITQRFALPDPDVWTKEYRIEDSFPLTDKSQKG